jgi:hypothetical protein
MVKFLIINESGESSSSEWESVRIKLPERYEESYELPFYDVTSENVITIKEPTFLVILHELIHSIQNLKWCSYSSCTGNGVYGGLMEQFNKQFPDVIDLKNSMFMEFFAGSYESRANWADELSAMIFGVVEQVDGKIVVVSEAQALNELLNEESLLKDFKDLSPYRGHKLIPFGHGKQEDCDKNRNFLSNLLKKMGEPIRSLGTILDFPFDEINVRSDGNCGIWAVLRALNPTENFTGATTPDQYASMRRLRTEAAQAARNAGDEQARIRLDTEDMAGSLIPEDFQYISALPLIGGRPIVIVQEGDIIPTIEVYRNGGVR